MQYRRTARAVFSGAMLAFLAALGLEAAPVRAQAPAYTTASSPAAGKIYTNKTVFKLPIKIDDRLRMELREVYLYVKDGAGDWLRRDAVMPTQKEFTFRVPHDGEYWFSVVTMDKLGRMTPPDVANEPPGLMVVVDTHPSKDMATAPAVPVTTGLAQAAMSQGTPPEVPAPVTPLPGPVMPPAVAAAPPVMPPPPALSMPPPGPPAMPVGMGNLYNSTPTPQVVMHHGDTSHPNRLLINTTRAAVDYRIDQVGPSGVGKVEVWMTADEGRTWQRYGEDADHRSPAEIDLPGEGVFGIRLVVSNGNGFGGRTPVAGDSPLSVVEVDVTKPFAQLREVEPIGANGTIDLRWSASDKNLGSEPINLYYAPSHQGPWMPVATNIKNDGLYHWAFPRNGGLSQFFVRLEVSDLAGNVTRCETQTPVVLDTTEPQVQVLSVSPIHGRPLAPMGN